AVAFKDDLQLLRLRRSATRFLIRNCLSLSPSVQCDVRFTPKSGHWNSVARCPLYAKSRHLRPITPPTMTASHACFGKARRARCTRGPAQIEPPGKCEAYGVET